METTYFATRADSIRSHLIAISDNQGRFCASLTAIAQTFGVSRERVRQLTKGLNLTQLPPPPVVQACTTCGSKKIQHYLNWVHKAKPDTTVERCSACCKNPQSLFLVCDRCKIPFKLEGRRRTIWLNNRRSRPDLKTLCDDCHPNSQRPTSQTPRLICGLCDIDFTAELHGVKLWSKTWIARRRPNRTLYCPRCIPQCTTRQARAIKAAKKSSYQKPVDKIA